MNKTPSIATMRRTAAEILAAAALEQFPGSLLLGGEGSSLGFHYDFIFPFPFQKEFLPLLEEKMRAIIKSDRAVELKEMVPRNAASFFEHHRQPYLAEAAESSIHSLVQIFHMQGFSGLCLPPYLNSSGEVGAFKLTDIKVLEEGVTRICGNAFFDKDGLKNYLKRFKKYAQTAHTILGQEMRLFSEYKEGFWIWHSKGETVRSMLLSLWRAEHVKDNFNFLATAESMTEKECLRVHHLFAPRTAQIVNVSTDSSQSEAGAVLEGMLATHSYTEARGYISCGEGELVQESISSLQLITKISKILGFESELVLCVGGGRHSAGWKKAAGALERALTQGQLDYARDEETLLEKGPRIEWRIQDALGRYWPGPYLEMQVEQRCLVRSLYGSIERLMALLLEQKNGELPFWLVPEQIRVFVVSKTAHPYAEECVLRLRNHGLRVSIDAKDQEALSSRVHNALREKVPYCIFIGDNELRTARLTVRTSGSAEEEKMGIEALVQKMTGLKKD